MQRYLRIYASHIPDDTTRIDVVSTYFKDDALLWYEAREYLLDLRGSQDSWKAFSSKLEERFTVTPDILVYTILRSKQAHVNRKAYH